MLGDIIPQSVRRRIGRVTDVRPTAQSSERCEVETNCRSGGSDRPGGIDPIRLDCNEGPDSIEIGQVFEILKNERRRFVLRYLSAHGGQATLSELAEHLAARECGKAVEQITSQERKRVYVGLYQSHLPKMADVSVISYDKPRGTIEKGENFECVVDYLPDGRDDCSDDRGRRSLDFLTEYVR